MCRIIAVSILGRLPISQYEQQLLQKLPSFYVDGVIVAYSLCEKEYNKTLVKAVYMKALLQCFNQKWLNFLENGYA
jgi:hypothetical protein